MREKQGGNCYYTGYPMEFSFVNKKAGTWTEKTKMQVSCDRLDNTKGYEQGNVVLCCTMINKMKNNLSMEEFYKICKDIIKYKAS